MKLFIFALTGVLLISLLIVSGATESLAKSVTVHPEEYPHALRNPIKGFRGEGKDAFKKYPYVTLVRDYIKWNDLEQSKDDDLVANINAYTDRDWAKYQNTGVKVIPRVYLDWDEKIGNEYWPKDMDTGDYSSPEFKDRVVRLIEALGKCWDNNPRVAWIHMGIIGFWGEHHSPGPDQEIQEILGKAFQKAFQNKRVLIRHPGEFENFEFGIYWDSWGHQRQTYQLMHGAGIERLNATQERWKTHPIEGEAAYNWGDYRIQPGDDPNDTLRDPTHREFFIDTIRNLHCSALGWVSRYDPEDQAVAIGAEAVQRAFGYRYVLEEFTFTSSVRTGGGLKLRFQVKNTGSAPFYYDWPIKVSLLDPESKVVMWSRAIEGADIRTWLPGNYWDEDAGVYREPAKTYSVRAEFKLPESTELPSGHYIVALSIPDPYSTELGIRFAIKNYMKGDFHPLGMITYGRASPAKATLSPEFFTDPMQR